MRSVMNAQQMREVDKYMIETLHIPGLVLMENAAVGTAEVVMERAEPGDVIHVFCGTGNNGGDGLACARVLMAHGYDVYVVIVGDPRSYAGDALSNYKMFEFLEDRVLKMSRLEDLYGWQVPKKPKVIVDAIFGTGLSREVSGICEDAVGVINKSSAEVVSIDMPSGISADNGRVLGCAVEADFTVTFQYPKLGQYLYPGRQYVGELRIVPIGVDAGIDEVVQSAIRVCEDADPDIRLAPRHSDTNKGTYGRLFVVAGSRGMAGAAGMCAKAAYAAGAGLVTAGVPESIVDIVQVAAPEATCLPLPEENGRLFGGSRVAVAQAMYRKTAMAVGPGLGIGEGLKDLIADILEDDTLCRVVDADALNALDNDLHILAHMKGELIFTPHPAEFARLLGTELGSILEHPIELASAFARQCGVVLVLKGATTIVADRGGAVTLVPAGSPGMAKGGSGDVLTGVIAGFAAQGFTAYQSAILGVYYCAMAGEAAACRCGEYSMTPLDTLQELGAVIQKTCEDTEDAWKPEHVPVQIQARAHQAAAAHPAAPVSLPSRPAPARRTPRAEAAPVPVLPPEPETPEEPEPQPAAAQPRQIQEEPVREESKAATAPQQRPVREQPRPVSEQPVPKEEQTAPQPVESVPSARSALLAREERRQESERQSRRRTEAEREQVRAKLREQTTQPQPPVTSSSGDQPRSRAEAARQTVDHANDALNTLRRRAAEEPTEAEKEAKRQSTAAHAAIDQNTRVAPSVTQQGQRVAPQHPAADETVRSEAQRHRDELNAQIQRELKKQEQRDKPAQQRTRRRIG